MIKFRAKLFTQYDDSDNLKRMKDLDILAEKPKKPTTKYSDALFQAGKGAAIGAGVGAIAGAFTKNKVPGTTILGKMKRGGKTGALVGAALLGGKKLYDRHKENKENQFYNDRLEYAQRHARRREGLDWKTNMTLRDGYSY